MHAASSFVDILRERAVTQADRLAYLLEAGRDKEAGALTYGELDRRARVIAGWLQAHCAPGERALLVYPAGLDYVCGFFGCLYAGVVAVPAYPPTRSKTNRNTERLLNVARDADATVCLTTAATADVVADAFRDTGLGPMRAIATDSLDVAGAAAWRECAPAARDLAFLQYTSGSTGSPKGVMVSHGNLVANSALIYQRFGHADSSKGVIWLPPYHDMGLIGGILQPLYGGFPTVLMSPVSFVQRPWRWLQAISRHGASTSGGPDFAYAQCVRRVRPEHCEGLDLSSWRVAFTGAEPIRRETLDAFAERFAPYGFNADAFYPCFGLAESTLFVTGSDAGRPLRTLTVDADELSVSRAVEATRTDAQSPVLDLVGCGSTEQPGHRIVLADPVTGEPLAAGRIGEVWVQGPSVAGGYWRNAEASAATFGARLSDGSGPFMRTGDLGFTFGDELFVTGRIKDLILVRGRNHYPQDIEATIARSDARFAHGSIAVFDVIREGEAEVVALCEAVLDPGEAAGIFNAASEAVARVHGFPLFGLGFVAQRALPRTSSGKLQRSVCRVSFDDGTFDISEYVTRADARKHAGRPAAPDAPAQSVQRAGTVTELRAWAIAAIAEIGHLDSALVDPDASFFELGLDSIELVMLADELESRLGVPVEPAMLFDYPTINKALAHLSGIVPSTEPVQRPDDTSQRDTRVAVVGVSCRFPGADDAQAFWSLLSNGRDAIGEVPRQRWDVDAFYAPEPPQPGRMTTRWGGFIDDIDAFDAAFFNITPREAQQADPQHRILLQLAWQSLEDAGLDPHALAGSRTGVFLGVSSSDYARLQTSVDELDAYSATGNAHSIAANRISYYFDFRGPSLAVDTACSSSLVALHLACRSLLDGECDLALVGGVNLMIGPELHVVFSQARMMASDSRCKAFDDDADGYVRGEGAAFVVLRRSADALHGGERQLALIRGTAISQDGRSNGMTAPNGLAQEAVIRAALTRAGVDCASVDYVEAHGTGTRLGDPVEYRALQKTYASAPRDRPLLIGSVKGNIGHLEAAAGIAGLIKVVLSLQHGAIPPHLHFRQLNRTIPDDGKGVSVCAAGHPWARGERARIAGLSSFGFGGTNCHVIVEEAPREEAPNRHTQPDVALEHALLTLSAASEASLQMNCARYAAHLASFDRAGLANACYTTQVGRAHLPHRLALRADDAGKLTEQLTRFAAGERRGFHYGVSPRQKRGVAFMFTGQGAQFRGMGRRLFQSQPVFRRSIEACATRLAPRLAEPLLAVLYGDDGPDLTERTEFAQPAILAFEYSLAQLWREWGIEPVAVIGHSAGEYAAACVAGALSLDDALALVTERGRLMASLPATGLMVALHAGEPQVCSLLASHGSRVEIAALNGPKLTVISGAEADVRDVIAQAQTQNMAFSVLSGHVGFHSAQLDPILGDFEKAAAAVRYSDPSVPIWSNLSGEAITSAHQLNGQYWRRHARQTVQFERCVSNAARSGIDVFLEVGPDATLTSIGKRQTAVRDARFVASLRNGVPEDESMADALAQLYASGCDPDWRALQGGARAARIALPPYAFDKKRFWVSATREAPGQSLSTASANESVHRSPTSSEPRMQERRNHDATSRNRRPADNLLDELRTTVASLLELDAAQIDVDAPFLEMGADSLVLLAAVQAVEDRYGVTVSITDLFDQTSTIRLLAAFIEARLVIESAACEDEPANTIGAARLDTSTPLATPAVPLAQSGGVEEVIRQQIALMSTQLDLLGGVRARPSGTAPLPVQTGATARARNSVAPAGSVRQSEAAAPFAWAQVELPRDGDASALPAWSRPPVTVTEALGATRQAHLDELIAAHTGSTPGSKALTQQYRGVLADNRASAGFRLSTKEMVYPVVGKRAAGARMWDIDGNEYIDFTMGFGANLFGHSPSFIVDALREQLEDGFQLGPQSALAGRVAQKIAAMTGQQRVAFCNSGSEAIMTAVRLARNVTKRSRIAIFSGSYHGTFDGVLARARIADGALTTMPVTPGTPASFVEQEVLVLEYGDAQSLKIIEAHAHELAAVIVEPVQSRYPACQPKAFLEALRKITRDASIAFIWDEVISGFRAAPGGAQQYFGIDADIATYGKVIGGGMPIGVLAGNARFMDAIDGGTWSYGNDSHPLTEQTFFAGTFNKHPLTMAASLAVLQKLEQEGPALHQQLNERTARLADTLNAYFEADDVPVRIEYFSSLFRFAFAGNMDLLFYHLMRNGIYIWEGRNCFLSTAHTDEDVDCFVAAVKNSVRALRAGGFLAPSANSAPAVPLALPFNPSQQRFIDWHASDAQQAAVCHIPFSLKLSGPLDAAALQDAFNAVIARHDALRASLDIGRGVQHFLPEATLQIGSLDLSSLTAQQQAAALDTWQQAEVSRPFDIEAPPLMRATLVRTGIDQHVLCVTVHHAVCDGLSLAMLLQEVSALYTASARGVPCALPAPLSPVAYQERVDSDTSAAGRHAQAYWQRKIDNLAHGAQDRRGALAPAPSASTRGARSRVHISRASYALLQAFAKAQRCTPFMVLFAAFEVLLLEQAGVERCVLGVPSIGRLTRADEMLVGNYVSVLPVACEIDVTASFGTLLERVKAELLGVYSHARHAPAMPFAKGGARQPLCLATFNMEPEGLPPLFGDLRVELAASPVTHVEFNLMMNVTECADDVIVELDARFDVLDPKDAADWLGHYCQILARIAQDGGTWLPLSGPALVASI